MRDETRSLSDSSESMEPNTLPLRPTFGSATSLVTIQSSGVRMELDPSVVHAFSRQVHDASTTIGDTHLGAGVTASCDSLSGSTSQYAARVVGQFMSSLVGDYAENVDRMGTSVTSAAETLVVQDSAVKADLDKAWPGR